MHEEISGTRKKIQTNIKQIYFENRFELPNCMLSNIAQNKNKRIFWK